MSTFKKALRSIGCGLVAVSILASSVSAYTVGTWNFNYTIKTVRQNGTGFWFTVVPKNPNDGGNSFFGCWNSLPNYNTLVSIILTAKATGRTVSFFVDKQCLTPGDTVVKSITGVDIN